MPWIKYDIHDVYRVQPSLDVIVDPREKPKGKVVYFPEEAAGGEFWSLRVETDFLNFTLRFTDPEQIRGLLNDLNENWEDRA